MASLAQRSDVQYTAPRGARGFTLVELLVVVAIIGILAAMLFPVFASREAAHKVSCLSNVKQITVAVMMYSADYDDRFPLSAYRNGPGGNGGGGGGGGGGAQPPPNSPIWTDYVAEYVQNADVFKCPCTGPESRHVVIWAERGWLSIGLNRDLRTFRPTSPWRPRPFRSPPAPFSLQTRRPPTRTVAAAAFRS